MSVAAVKAKEAARAKDFAVPQIRPLYRRQMASGGQRAHARSVRSRDRRDRRHHPADASDLESAEMPFSGVKESGIGREGGAPGSKDYLEAKFIKTRLI